MYFFSLNSLTRKAKTSANENGDFEPKIIPRFSEIGKFSIAPFPEPLKCFLLDLENCKANLERKVFHSSLITHTMTLSVGSGT